MSSVRAVIGAAIILVGMGLCGTSGADDGRGLLDPSPALRPMPLARPEPPAAPLVQPPTLDFVPADVEAAVTALRHACRAWLDPSASAVTSHTAEWHSYERELCEFAYAPGFIKESTALSGGFYGGTFVMFVVIGLIVVYHVWERLWDLRLPRHARRW